MPIASPHQPPDGPASKAQCEPPPQSAPDHESKKGGWKLGRQLAGWGLMAIGAIGIVMPVMPGWIFIGWGAVILAPDVPFIGRLLDRIAEKVPQLRSAIDRARGKHGEKSNEPHTGR